MRAFPLHSNAGLGRPVSLLGIALLSGLASHHVVDRKIISPTAPTASGGAHARRLLARSGADEEEEEEDDDEICYWVDKDHSSANKKLVLQLVAEKKSEEAETVCRAWTRAVEKRKPRPQNADAHFKLSCCLDKLDDHDGEVNHLRLALVADPTHSSANANLAWQLYADEEFDEAEAAFKAWIENDLEDPDAQYEYGEFLARMNRHDDAVSAYENALAVNEKHKYASNGYDYLGGRYQELGKLEEAKAAFEKAVDANPQNLGAHSNLVALLEKMGNKEEAVAAYRDWIQSLYTYRGGDWIKVDQQNADAHTGLGGALWALKRHNEAKPAYERAAELNPYASAYQYNLGLCCSHMGQTENAETAYRKAITLDPQNAAAHQSLVALRMKMHEDAATANKRWIDADTQVWGSQYC